ncbi:MAG TPA: winged helix-turn-helix domain-containing protein [Candidatus Sulfotelmatobacter sp.]|nr:winged helix-turn-helix domain-containing protein [Candidatus Sulfotelmatobacter sp.]
MIGHSTIRFSVFELDLEAGELRRNGLKIRLQEQPFQILVSLLEQPGKVVIRDELRKKLWPADTFVDFDHGLNAAIRRLREALDDSAETPRFVETVARRGYRFIAPVDAPDAPGVEKSERVTPSAGRIGSRKWAAIAACVVVLVLAAGIYYLRPGRTAHIDSVAVLPFRNVGGNADSEYLSDGITESLIGSLARVPGLKVKSRDSSFHYKGKDVDAQKAGSDLGVSALVSGRVVPQGDRIEVSAELTDVSDNTEIWGQHYSGKSTEIISLQQQMAGDIADKLRSRLSTVEKQRVTKRGTTDPAAYELYLKGRYVLNQRPAGRIGDAISYFEQAIVKDPGYAEAYSSLADAYYVMSGSASSGSEDIPKANAAARKALQLDPTLAHPHAVLGFGEMLTEWDFAAGEAEFKKAFEIDPNDSTAHWWHADAIGIIGGREQEALAEAELAHQLDPLSPHVTAIIGYVHNYARRFDDAIAVCQKVVSENPTSFGESHDCLAWAYWGKRMYPQVIEEWKLEGQVVNDRYMSEYASAMEQGFRSGGWKGALAKGIATKRSQYEAGHKAPFEIAECYADLGDKEQAFRWLNTAYQERDVELLNLRTDYLLDPLRSDPRFSELVHKIGLPQ